jgi:uncharacterized protein (DUF58 family)
MIRLTPLGGLMLLALFLLYVASLTSQSPLLLFPIGICVGLYAVNGFLAWHGLRNLEAHPPPSVMAGEGEPVSEPWRFVNRGGRRFGMVRVESPVGTLMRLERIDSGQSVTTAPELFFPKRGVYPYSNLVFSTAYPFGLLRAQRALLRPGEVIVHPSAYPVPAAALRAAGFDVMLGGKFKGKRTTSAGFHFAGVRPIHPGDPLKQVHWKSSAKGLGLMVKTFDEELSGRFALIMDSGASGNGVALDNCVRATASLIVAAQDAGHHVEWFELGKEQHLLVPPFTDGSEILEALARVEMQPDCVTLERLRNAVARISTRSAVCLMLTRWTEPAAVVVEEMLARKRKVSVYLPVGTEAPPVDAVARFGYSEQEIHDG